MFAFNATTLRVLRVMRVFRMINVFKRIKRLLLAINTSVPSLINVGALLFLLYFVYSVAGMSLFGKLNRGEFVNDYANFETFYNSMITLFRASTGES